MMSLPICRLLQLKKKYAKEKNPRHDDELLNSLSSSATQEKPTQEKQAQDNDEPFISSSFSATQEKKLENNNKPKGLPSFFTTL
jgi:hypothetical protein